MSPSRWASATAPDTSDEPLRVWAHSGMPGSSVTPFLAAFHHELLKHGVEAPDFCLAEVPRVLTAYIAGRVLPRVHQLIRPCPRLSIGVLRLEVDLVAVLSYRRHVWHTMNVTMSVSS